MTGPEGPNRMLVILALAGLLVIGLAGLFVGLTGVESSAC